MLAVVGSCQPLRVEHATHLDRETKARARLYLEQSLELQARNHFVDSSQSLSSIADLAIRIREYPIARDAIDLRLRRSGIVDGDDETCELLKRLAEAYIADNRLPDALDIVTKYSWAGQAVLEGVVIAQLRHGDTPGAMKTAAGCDDTSHAFAEIVIEASRQNRRQTAEKAFEQVKKGDLAYLKALAALGGVRARDHDNKSSGIAFAEVRELIRKGGGSPPYDPAIEHIGALVDAYLYCGDMTNAIDAIGEFLKDNPSGRISLLYRVAMEKRGDVEKLEAIKTLLDKAFQESYAKEVDNERKRLRRVIIDSTKGDERTVALEKLVAIWREEDTTVAHRPVTYRVAEVYEMLIETYLDEGRSADALRLSDQIAVSQRYNSLCKIGRYLISHKKIEEAIKLSALLSGDVPSEMRYLTYVSRDRMDANDNKYADKALELLLALVPKDGRSSSSRSALRTASIGLYVCGRSEQADTVFALIPISQRTRAYHDVAENRVALVKAETFDKWLNAIGDAADRAAALIGSADGIISTLKE